MSTNRELDLLDHGKPIIDSGAFRVRPNGLVVTGDPSFEEWECLWRTLSAASAGTQWAIGDWVVYGDGRGEWGERYKRAVEVTGRSYQGLINAAVLARKFEFKRRRLNLTYAHHREVGQIESEEEQERMLDLAEEKNLSSKDLRRMRQAKKKSEDKVETKDERGVITIRRREWGSVLRQAEEISRGLWTPHESLRLEDLRAMFSDFMKRLESLSDSTSETKKKRITKRKEKKDGV